MIGIGIIGFGFIGRTHAAIYQQQEGCRIVAIADRSITDKRGAEGGGTNGDEHAVDLNGVTLTREADDVLNAAEVDAVSICTPTSTHSRYAIAALSAGKHVLIEKPIGRTSADARMIADAAAKHPRLICMPAMCMRYWPGWDWLKQAIDEERYGKVQAATFTRLSAAPQWGQEYLDRSLSGGAALDLHIHDVDFIRYCFGEPDSVMTTGTLDLAHGMDHVLTTYHFAKGPELVAAEGGWLADPAFPFTMQYRVVFDDAVAEYEFNRTPPLTVYSNGEINQPRIADETGWDREVAAFLNYVTSDVQPDRVSVEDGVRSIELIETEMVSLERGAMVSVRRS